MGNRVAQILLEKGAVRFSPSKPFTYASGLTGPLYCDNRTLLAHPKEREEIVEALEAELRGQGWQPEGILALATGAIAYGAWLAEKLALPFGYIRSQKKTHGSEKLIEGFHVEGAKVVVVEDLINQATSLGGVLPQVKESFHLLGVLSVVDYQMAAAQRFLGDLGVRVCSLVDFSHLVEEALSCGLIKEAEAEDLRRWQGSGRQS